MVGLDRRWDRTARRARHRRGQRQVPGFGGFTKRVSGAMAGGVGRGGGLRLGMGARLTNHDVAHVGEREVRSKQPRTKVERQCSRPSAGKLCSVFEATTRAFSFCLISKKYLHERKSCFLHSSPNHPNHWKKVPSRRQRARRECEAEAGRQAWRRRGRDGKHSCR